MLDNWWEDLPGTGNSSHVVVVGGVLSYERCIAQFSYNQQKFTFL